MARPGTAAFLAGWAGRDGNVRRILITLTATVPTARTLRLAEGDFIDPDQNRWEPFITRFDGIRATGAFADCSLEPVTVSFKVARRRENARGSGGFTTSCNITGGTTVTIAAGQFWTFGVVPGMSVSGAGVVPGTTVSALTSATVLTLSTPATNATGVALTFAEGAAIDIVQALADYQWAGAVCTVYGWADAVPYQDPALGYVSFTNDRLQMFRGVVTGTRVELDGVQFNAAQDTAWNSDIPDNVATLAAFPNAPESLFGNPIPWVIGDFRALPLGGPWPNNFTYWPEAAMAGMARNTIPALVIDKGTGGGVPRIAIAAHGLAIIQDSQLNGGSA